MNNGLEKSEKRLEREQWHKREEFMIKKSQNNDKSEQKMKKLTNDEKVKKLSLKVKKLR